MTHFADPKPGRTFTFRVPDWSGTCSSNFAVRVFSILLCLSSCLPAQIQDLATTDDGQQTYFSTAYRFKGSSQPGYLKIFRYVANGFQLFRQLTFFSDGVDSNFYMAERPVVSGNGQTVAYTASRGCQGGSHCLCFTYSHGMIAVPGGPDREISDGMVTLSPDGRYALIFNMGGIDAFDQSTAWLDLTQSSPVTLMRTQPIGDGRQALATGGVALLSDDKGPLLWNRGSIQRLSFSATPGQARVNTTAQKIVYEGASSSGHYELHSYDVASARDVVIATGPAISPNIAFYFHSRLTNDGAQVAYLLNNQLMVQGTDGSAARQLTSAPEGVSDAVISGYGNLAYAVTTSGRLLRIDVASGAETELSAAVPHIQIVGGALVPGARLDLSVSAAPANRGDPAILSDGPAAPIIARSASGVTMQIPWEATAGSTVKLVVPGNPSVFEEDNDNPLQAGIPAFYTLPMPPEVYPPYALAVHQDFKALVTDSYPAKPGEVVHFYFTGLGAVQPRIATGAVTLAGTLYRITTPFSCQIPQPGILVPPINAKILFAGLAPGFIGVEQVDMQIPTGLTQTHPSVDCESGEPVGTIVSYAQIPVQP
jgi:uncharacterized protein (TIGR03437 family)